MKVKYENSVKYQIEQRLTKFRRKIILRKDLADLGCYRQISRALKKLVKEKKLANISTDVYAKMRPSVLNDQYVLNRSFQILAREALNRLGAKWEPENIEKQYNLEQTSQIPVKGRIILKSRLNRTIEWNGMTVKYVKEFRKHILAHLTSTGLKFDQNNIG